LKHFYSATDDETLKQLTLKTNVTFTNSLISKTLQAKRAKKTPIKKSIFWGFLFCNRAEGQEKYGLKLFCEGGKIFLHKKI